MTQPPPALLGAALLLSLPIAFATLLPAQLQEGQLRTLPTPTLLSTNYGRTVAGNLLGYSLPDVVVVAGTTAVLVTCPAVHQSAAPLPLPADLPPEFAADQILDLAIVPGAGEDGRDALALAVPGGAFLWSWRATATPRLVRVGGNAWQGATRVLCADVDADGTPDLVGLMATGNRLRFLPRGVGTNGWFFDCPAPVRDLAVADFVVAPGLEVAVATDNGVAVYSRTGTSLASYPLANSRVQLTSACLAGVACVCMATHGTDGADRVTAFAPGLTLLDTFTVPHPVGALTAADPDGDGNASLSVTYLDQATPVVFANIGTPTLFHRQPTSVYVSGTTVAGNTAPLLWLDLDGSGTSEYLYANRSIGAVVWSRPVPTNDAIQFAQIQPLMQGVRDYAVTPLFTRPADATHVEVMSWPVALGPGVNLSFAPGGYGPRRSLGDLANGLQLHLTVDPGSPQALAIRYVRMEGLRVTRRYGIRCALAFAEVDRQALASYLGDPQLNLVPGDYHAFVLDSNLGTTGSIVQPPNLPPPGGGTPPAPPGP